MNALHKNPLGFVLFSFFLGLCLLLAPGRNTAEAKVFSTETQNQAEVSPTPPPSPEVSKTETPTATLIDLSGEVRILKKDTEDWKLAEKNQTLLAGDQIMTGKNSFADLTYDSYLLNITHIKESTKAEIRSINPTDIYLEDGSIFSALDGLDDKGQYQIATPTAVAAVRGTHFEVDFNEDLQEFNAMALPSGEAGHTSRIFVSDPKLPNVKSVEVTENLQMAIPMGHKLHASLLKPADQARLQAGREIFSRMGERMPKFQERRQEGKVRFEEMKKQNLIKPQSHAPTDVFLERKPEAPLEKLEEVKEEKAPQESSGEFDQPPPASLEGISDLERMVEENEPQTMKPFGSFKPERVQPEGRKLSPAENRPQPQGTKEPSRELRSGPDGNSPSQQQPQQGMRQGAPPQGPGRDPRQN